MGVGELLKIGVMDDCCMMEPECVEAFARYGVVWVRMESVDPTVGMVAAQKLERGGEGPDLPEAPGGGVVAANPSGSEMLHLVASDRITSMLRPAKR